MYPFDSQTQAHVEFKRKPLKAQVLKRIKYDFIHFLINPDVIKGNS